LVQELGRWATDITGDSRDHLPVPAVISGVAKGELELTRSRFRRRYSRTACCKPVIYVFL